MNQEKWYPADSFLTRLRQSYLHAVETEKELLCETGLIWSKITTMREDVHLALTEGRDELGDLLAHPLKTNLYYGVDNFCRDIQGKNTAPATVGTYRRIAEWTDSTAQALGGKRLWHPHPNFRNPPQINDPATYADELVKNLIVTLGFDIHFPDPFPNEEGLRTSQGLITYRALHSLYQAQRMREYSVEDSVAWLEIGAGMGRVAQFAWQMGQLDYTIADLPLALVGQACFLAATVGADNIRLPGEEFKQNDHSRIKLMSPKELFSHPTIYEVALNADSLTEMSREYAQQYISFLSKYCAVLISINHERNIFSVMDLARPKHRNLYPLRGGYAEEIYYFNRKIDKFNQ